MLSALDRLGTDAYNTVTTAARVEALTSLFWGVVLLGVAVGFLGVAYYARQRRRAIRGAPVGVRPPNSNASEDGWTIALVLSAWAGAFAFTGSLSKLIDPWAWVALPRPELWVARQLLGLGQ